MKERTLTIPEIGLIAGTRVALGMGIGLLLADKLNDQKRKGAGWALLAVGALTTIPLVLNVMGKGRWTATRASVEPDSSSTKNKSTGEALSPAEAI
jgi:hypothetical protein